MTQGTPGSSPAPTPATANRDALKRRPYTGEKRKDAALKGGGKEAAKICNSASEVHLWCIEALVRFGDSPKRRRAGTAGDVKSPLQRPGSSPTPTQARSEERSFTSFRMTAKGTRRWAGTDKTR